jgi:hypothetical protein
MRDDRRRLAEAVRAACLKAAQEAYEDAAMSGLCKEGAIEAALGAISTIDLDAVIENLPSRGKAS